MSAHIPTRSVSEARRGAAPNGLWHPSLSLRVSITLPIRAGAFSEKCRQNRGGKTGLTTQENECEKGKLRLREIGVQWTTAE